MVFNFQPLIRIIIYLFIPEELLDAYGDNKEW